MYSPAFSCSEISKRKTPPHNTGKTALLEGEPVCISGIEWQADCSSWLREKLCRVLYRLQPRKIHTAPRRAILFLLQIRSFYYHPPSQHK